MKSIQTLEDGVDMIEGVVMPLRLSVANDEFIRPLLHCCFISPKCLSQQGKI
jgi:hypothetical protein